MGVLETASRIVLMGGAPGRAGRVAQMRAEFEARTGAFMPEDAWFEERSRAFWCDALTRGRFGRDVEAELGEDERACLGPIERAHRGLFRAEGTTLVDVWSGAEFRLSHVEDDSRAELEAGEGQLFDARVVGADGPPVVALLPGAVFHPRQATAAIGPVLSAARDAALPTHDTLDALLRMERTLRALSRVKAGYAYRIESLSSRSAAVAPRAASRAPA